MTRQEKERTANRERMDRKRNVVRNGIEKYIEGFEAQIENRFSPGRGGPTTLYVAHPSFVVLRRPRQMWVAGWNSAVVVEFMMRELGVARAEEGKTLAAEGAV